jgi:hypothetical protein
VLVYGNILPSYASQFYDPIANKWTRTFGQNTFGIQVGLLAPLNTGKVLLAGGHQKYAKGATRICMLYDPATNFWSQTGSMLSQPVLTTLTPLPDGRVTVPWKCEEGSSIGATASLSRPCAIAARHTYRLELCIILRECLFRVR